MIFKRLVSALLLCSVFFGLLALSGCHGQKALPTFEMPEDFDTSKQYDIVFWSKNESNPTQNAIYDKAIADFEALYPNINVIKKVYTDYKDIFNDVITNLPQRTTPNVCITYPDHIATYMQGENVMLPLDELMADERYGLGGSEVRFDSVRTDEIIPEFLDEGKIGGIQYALPYMRSTEACYINNDLVEALGFTLPETLTWDFIFEVSEYAMSLGRDENGNYIANGQSVLIPFIYKSTDNMMISMLEQLGAPYSNDEGDMLLFNDTTKDILEEIGSHVATGAFSTFATTGYPANYLNMGRCIFAIDSTAGATWMGHDSPLNEVHGSSVPYDIEVRAIPQYDTENKKMISQGPSLCIFNKEDSGEVLASWLFAQFLLTNDVQIAYSQTEGYIPVTSKAHESAEYQDYLSRAGEDNELYYDVKIDAAKLMLNNIESTFTTSVFNGSSILRNVAGEIIEETRKAVEREQVIDDAFFEKTFKKMNSLYKLDQYSGNDNNATQQIHGDLPAESKALLYVLGAVWLVMGAYFIAHTLKSRKNQ
ncbi:MAG: extracellular solute-binding protein [Clostridia bacterium]|nr:extracellular solute-binding protein [Clostridia bacterium]